MILNSLCSKGLKHATAGKVQNMNPVYFYTCFTFSNNIFQDLVHFAPINQQTGKTKSIWIILLFYKYRQFILKRLNVEFHVTTV